MSLILDVGALVALERNDRQMWRRLWAAKDADEACVTHGGVIGQVWRGSGPRTARLSIALRSIDVRSLDRSLGRRAGELLALTRQRDVIDAAVVLLAEDGDRIFTSDPKDLQPLAGATGRAIEIVVV